MSNHVHRFYAAVSVMAGHGNIKQRLIQAYEENLAVIDDHELPIVIKQSFADLRHMLSQVAPLNGEGRIRASVRKMSVLQANECAQKMLDIYGDIIRYADADDDSMPLAPSDIASIPPFLVKSV
jgi:hypothetical protein